MKKKMLFLAGPKNPAGKEREVSDSYVFLAKNLIKLRLIDEAVFVYNNYLALRRGSGQGSDPSIPSTRDSGQGLDPSARLSSSPSLRVEDRTWKRIRFCSLEEKNYGFLKDEYLGVFVRGNWREHKNLMNKLKFKKSFFYAADNQFLPTQVDGNIFDVIFVDEKHQVKAVKNKFPKAKSIIFDKPVDAGVFRPQKKKKIYDLCYIANFRQWKNHNSLFSAIKKIQDRKKILLRVALAGKVEPNQKELAIMLWKYGVRADIFEKVSQKKVAEVLNKSKFSVQLAELDANPRSLSESLACGVPVLANCDLKAGIRLVNQTTGLKCGLCELDKGLEVMLKKYKKFNPKKYFDKNLTINKIIERCFNFD